jgi:hypothetical protein
LNKFFAGLLLLAGFQPGLASDACLALSAVPALYQPGPVFLASYPTVESGPVQNVAFVYDNAVAAIALAACGRPDQAAQIADAMLAAQEHDRWWSDGRLRNGYVAGPVAHLPLPLPGWWEPSENKWVEDRYQVGSDTGNMAWAMLALLTVYEQTRAPQYLSGADRIARYVERSWSDVRPRGFSGGTFGHEPEPAVNTWKSTEHNTDLAAVFSRLARDSGDAHWAERARAAENFVAAMWGNKCRCFAVGTGEDGHSRNRLLALDAQLWPGLALASGTRRFPGALDTAMIRLATGSGFAYSEAAPGMWTEGTAQAGLLMALEGRDVTALTAMIARNRDTTGWYYAAEAPSLPTGFMLQTDPSKPRIYYHLPHLGALAWVALFEQRFNPFAGR